MNIKKDKTIILTIVGSILSLVVALNCFTIVTTASEASVESFGKVHEGKILTGFNLVAPWWGIDEYDTLLVTNKLDNKGIPSKDKFKTTMDIDYTGHFTGGNVDKIRGTTGNAAKYLNTHVENKILSCAIKAGGTVKESQAFFSEDTQIAMANYVISCVNDYINSDKVGGGYEITQIQFTDISLAEEVRRFMVQTKERQEQEDQQRSKLEIADLKAQEVTKVSAANREASADNKIAAKNNSDAKLYDMQQQALGNIALSKSLTPQLIEYTKAQRWNGVRSKIVSSGGSGLLVDTRNN